MAVAILAIVFVIFFAAAMRALHVQNLAFAKGMDARYANRMAPAYGIIAVISGVLMVGTIELNSLISLA